MEHLPSSVKELYRLILKRLSLRLDAPEAAQQAHWLLEALFASSRMDFMLDKPLQVSAAAVEKLEKVLARLDTHEPIQYVLEQAPFYGRMFRVKPGVLIPRPETEELLHRIVMVHQQGQKFQPAKIKPSKKQPDLDQSNLKQPTPDQLTPDEAAQDKPKLRQLAQDQLAQDEEAKEIKILDIGTGSGCIAISLALELSGSRIFALDISHEALALARENARQLQVDVQFVQSDILEEEAPVPGLFDILVSNPPYIREREAQLMQPNVLDWEPHLALFVKDEDPLLFYRRISFLAQSCLKPGGRIYFEINEACAAEVAQMLRQKGFEEVLIRQDMQGKDRMAEAYWPGKSIG